jgi:prepilin-type N-terminal cleavage/methylation domain-containing protein
MFKTRLKPMQKYKTQGFRRGFTLLRRGFTLLEITIALMIFAIMILMFAATIPIATRATKYGNTYAVASSIALHKVNQLEGLGYTQMDGTVLQTKGVLDSGWAGNTPNTRGMEAITGEFTDADKLWKFFPGGESTTGLRNTGIDAPKGSITLEPFMPSVKTISGTQVASLIRATITIEWRVAKNPISKFTVTRLIPQTKLL